MNTKKYTVEGLRTVVSRSTSSNANQREICGTRFEGTIMEDGCAVASVVRPHSEVPGLSESYRIKWYTANAEQRFIGFCDALSVGEVIAILGDRA